MKKQAKSPGSEKYRALERAPLAELPSGTQRKALQMIRKQVQSRPAEKKPGTIAALAKQRKEQRLKLQKRKESESLAESGQKMLRGLGVNPGRTAQAAQMLAKPKKPSAAAWVHQLQLPKTSSLAALAGAAKKVAPTLQRAGQVAGAVQSAGRVAKKVMGGEKNMPKPGSVPSPERPRY